VINRCKIVLMVGLVSMLSIAGTGRASAQMRWGHEATPAAGVCFYADVEHRGEYFCARPGESFDQLPGGMGDRISSIRVFGRVEALVFRDIRFRGPSARFSNDVRDLRREGWNDKISSIRVVSDAREWERERAPVWGSNQPIPREGACFYQNANFRGQYFCVPQGASIGVLPPGFNDRISSIRVMRSTVIIFSDGEFGGRSTRLERDVPNLGGNWNDRISSMRVY
jgi:hypothetical protein